MILNGIIFKKTDLSVVQMGWDVFSTYTPPPLYSFCLDGMGTSYGRGIFSNESLGER